MAWHVDGFSPAEIKKNGRNCPMRTITRPRIFVATGLLGIATLLGTTAGVASAVMGGGSQPGMQQEGTSAMQHEGQPGMQNE